MSARRPDIIATLASLFATSAPVKRVSPSSQKRDAARREVYVPDVGRATKSPEETMRDYHVLLNRSLPAYRRKTVNLKKLRRGIRRFQTKISAR